MKIKRATGMMWKWIKIHCLPASHGGFVQRPMGLCINPPCEFPDPPANNGVAYFHLKMLKIKKETSIDLLISPTNQWKSRRKRARFQNYVQNFWNFWWVLFRIFWVSRASWGRILPESEERIEKFVDRSENELRQKCEIFDAFSNKETRQNLFFSKLNFFDADRAEIWHTN